jgi:hypothetical protein
MDEAATIASIRKAWATADASEVSAQTLFESAQLAWENARVVKVRVAYAAAMVKPVKGAANLLNACRILFAADNLSAAERTKIAEGKKSTLRNYVDAGTALNEAQLAYSMDEPTEEERKIVAAAFRAGNKRDKQESKADKAEAKAKAETESDGGEEQADENANTFAALLAHVSRAHATADLLIKTGAVVTEADLILLAKVTDDLQLKLAVHAG